MVTRWIRPRFRRPKMAAKLDQPPLLSYPQALMPQTDAPSTQRRGLLGPRNLLVLVIAVICLVAGYMVLSAGKASFAAVLLVIGYCVLFPLAIAL